MRSLLMIPAGREGMADALSRTQADCLIFDLPNITRAIFDEIRRLSKTPLLYVQIADASGPAADADLDSIMALRPDGILFGGQNGAAVQQLSIRIAVREAELGIEDGATKILASVPVTPATIFHLGSFANASARLSGLIFARDDFERALEIAPDTTSRAAPAPPIESARHLMLFAAKAAKVPAIDASSPVETDAAELRQVCETARREGFSGKLALDECQVTVINEIYAKP